MNGFNKRSQKGKQLQDEVICFLDEYGINYILSGYEHLTGNGGHKNIKNNNDKTSIFIRHYPDISIVYNDISFLLEIKNSSGIEKECYKNYLRLKEELGINVILMLQNHKICKIEDLKLQSVNNYDGIAQMQVPTTEGIWKEPRMMEQTMYYEYLNAYQRIGKSTSGCSFAFIDFKNTKFYDAGMLLNPDELLNRETNGLLDF